MTVNLPASAMVLELRAIPIVKTILCRNLAG